MVTCMLDMKGSQIEQFLHSFLVLFSSADIGSTLIAAAVVTTERS